MAKKKSSKKLAKGKKLEKKQTLTNLKLTGIAGESLDSQ